MMPTFQDYYQDSASTFKSTGMGPEMGKTNIRCWLLGMEMLVMEDI